MKNDQILSLISEYCRQADMAETTFGRRAVNDGKLVHRSGGQAHHHRHLDRIQAYIAASMPGGLPPPRGLEVPPRNAIPAAISGFSRIGRIPAVRPYLQRKRVIAERVALELGSIHPGRRRCGCSTPAVATAPCWRG